MHRRFHKLDILQSSVTNLHTFTNLHIVLLLWIKKYSSTSGLELHVEIFSAVFIRVVKGKLIYLMFSVAGTHSRAGVAVNPGAILLQITQITRDQALGCSQLVMQKLRKCTKTQSRNHLNHFLDSHGRAHLPHAVICGEPSACKRCHLLYYPQFSENQTAAYYCNKCLCGG